MKDSVGYKDNREYMDSVGYKDDKRFWVHYYLAKTHRRER